MAITKVNAVRTNTHPSDDPAGISHNKCKIRHVFCYHRAGTDKGVLPNGDTADDRTVCPESRTSANERRAQFIHAPDLAARVKYVGKDHRRAAKYIVLQSHTLV